jgi:hypothetical protein
VHSVVSKARYGDALFFNLGWDRYVFDKKRVGTHYAKLVFLHPARSVGHIVHYGASGERNIEAQFFMLRWAQCGLNKKRVGTRYAELVFFIWSSSAFRCDRVMQC